MVAILVNALARRQLQQRQRPESAPPPAILTCIAILLTPLESKCLAFEAPASSSAPASRPAFELAGVDDRDLALLVDVARRTVQGAAAGRLPLVSSYRPASLRSRRCIGSVTVRRIGRAIGEAVSAEQDVYDAVRMAAESAAKMLPRDLPRTVEAMSRLGIEVELLGPRENTAAGLDEEGRFQRELCAAFEPGVDGIGVDLKGRIGLIRPSVVLARNYTPELALQHVESDAGFVAETKKKQRGDIHYFRFRTVHLWQPDAFSPAVRLQRGLRLVPPAAVTKNSLDRANESLDAHVRRRLRRDAWFAYERLSDAGRYSDYNSLFGQFEAAWSLGSYGRATAQPPCVDAAARLVAAAQSFVQPLGPEYPARAIISTGDAPPLATTSMYLAVLCRFPSVETRLAPATLADAVRLVQNNRDSEGRFDTTFPPEPSPEGRAFAAAIALIGLLEYAGDKPNDEVDRAIRTAIRFYSKYFKFLPDRSLAMWIAPAMAAAYQRKPDPPTSDLLLAAGDWIVGHQVPDGVGNPAELVGGIADREEPKLDADTARCVIALSDALAMARRLGDKQREQRYDAALRLAVRFVMQLQFRREECYYIGDPADVLGGVRMALWDSRLRVNDSATALWALTRARTELFGPR